MLRFALVLSMFAVAGCATVEQPQLTPVEARAQALAALLQTTARTDPARVEQASAEMSALADALERAPMPVSPQAQSLQPLAAAPDLSQARSLMHGIHLASYRQTEHVSAGWRRLSGEFNPLSDLQPRVEPVDLADQGQFLRLKAGPFDTAAEAQSACASFEASGHWCQVTDFTGGPVD